MIDDAFLIVASGFHKGAKVRLPRGESRVGSDMACSVVIVDDALEGKSFRITVDETIQVQGDCIIVLSKGTVVLPGEVLDVVRTCSFSVGDTSFELELPRNENVEAKKVKRKLWKSLLPVSACIAALGGAAVICVFALGHRAPEHTAAATLSSHSESSDPPTMSLATVFLRKRLDGLGLNRIVVAPRADGAILVSGVLAPGRLSEWAAIRQQYDERFGAARVLVEQFDAPSSVPSIHVAAVWSGTNPYMIDDHGSRLRPGASLDDGWSIETIDDQNVVLRLGARSVALRY